MTDMSHPQPSHPEEDIGGAAPAAPRSLSELGEASIHIVILISCLLLITPVGNLVPISVLLGLLIFAFSAQLVLRFPYIVMPDFFRNGIERLSMTQKVIAWLSAKAPRLQRFQREVPHWLMQPPFDIFPRAVLAVCGLAVIAAATVPWMAHLLGLAGVLMSGAILARHLGVFFLGAALMSWSSVLPLFSG